MQTVLNYLVDVVADLAGIAVLVGIAFAYARRIRSKRGMLIMCAGVALALVASAVVAVLRQTTNLIDTGALNMPTFIAAGVAGVVFLLTFIKPIGKLAAVEYLRVIALAVFAFCYAFAEVPTVYLYPATFGLTSESVISTDFAVRITCYLAGWLLVVLVSLSTFKAFKTLGRRLLGICMSAIVVILGSVQIMSCVRIMIGRRMIKQNPVTFNLTVFFSNNGDLFIFLVMAIALGLAIAVIVLSLRDDEPYSNPAEHRKNKAKWRNRRRWSICVIVCIVLTALVLTVVEDYTNQSEELSPVEECEVRDGAVYVPLSQVEDGELHRFAYTTVKGDVVKLENGDDYTTEGGVAVRFIIIKKPNSSAYGVGLDACEICGTTGYFERDGQVICNKCDVVMNINTIGFKGGCNPIVVDYRVEDGYIVLDTDVLSAYEKIPGSAWN